MSEGSAGITRRRLLAGAGVVLAAGATAGYGRFLVGDEFEEHLASVFDISPEAASWLTANAQERSGGLDWQVQVSSFVAATTWPGKSLLPDAVRERAYVGMLDQLVQTAADRLTVLGLRQPPGGQACAGLLRS